MSSSPKKEDCADVKRANDHAKESLNTDLYRLSMVISDKMACQDQNQANRDEDQVSFNCEGVSKSQMSSIPSQKCRRVLQVNSFPRSETKSDSSKDPSECLEDCEVPGDEESTESTEGSTMEGANVESQQRVVKKKSTTLDRSKLRKGKWTVGFLR
jgi:hypothetical protein